MCVFKIWSQKCSTFWINLGGTLPLDTQLLDRGECGDNFPFNFWKPLSKTNILLSFIGRNVQMRILSQVWNYAIQQLPICRLFSVLFLGHKLGFALLHTFGRWPKLEASAALCLLRDQRRCGIVVVYWYGVVWYCGSILVWCSSSSSLSSPSSSSPSSKNLMCTLTYKIGEVG